MSSKTEKIENYFKTLNPLAEKISSDISDIADTYAQLWATFTPDEQYDVINVTLIKPDIVLKYFNDLTTDRSTKKRHSSAMLSKDDTTIITDTDSNNDHLSLSSTNSNSYRSNDFSHIYLYNGKDLFTYSQIITALRYNQDDLCGIYRDEHSEPFNSKTKSQMNLNVGTMAADANAKIERAQKKYSEIKLATVSGFDEIKKGRVDHVPELCAKLASLNKVNATDNGQDGNVVRKSFMSKLFNSKTNTVPVKMPKPKLSEDQVDSLSGINLVIDTNASKEFDSMSTKSAGSCDKHDDISDRSRLINANDDDDDDDLNVSTILSKPINYDFLNNW